MEVHSHNAGLFMTMVFFLGKEWNCRSIQVCITTVDPVGGLRQFD